MIGGFQAGALSFSNLGPNLVVNGTFDTNTNSWVEQGSSTMTVVSGALRIVTPTTNGESGAKHLITGLIVGRTYRVSAKIRSVSSVSGQSGSIRWSNGNVTSVDTIIAGGSSASFVTCVGNIIPAQTSISLFLINGGTVANQSTFEYDDVSLRLVS